MVHIQTHKQRGRRLERYLSINPTYKLPSVNNTNVLSTSNTPHKQPQHVGARDTCISEHKILSVTTDITSDSLPKNQNIHTINILLTGTCVMRELHLFHGHEPIIKKYQLADLINQRLITTHNQPN